MAQPRKRNAAEESSHELTEILARWGVGRHEALAQLIPLVYEDLRRIARRQLGNERSGHTLQPTALVNEAYLRLAQYEGMEMQNRQHFFAMAAEMMRRILIDHARRRRAQRRGGGVGAITIDVTGLCASPLEVDVLALDDALKRLELMDARMGRVVELRFYAGLTTEEAAGVLGVSSVTIKREWALAKAWLQREIGLR